MWFPLLLSLLIRTHGVATAVDAEAVDAAEHGVLVDCVVARVASSRAVYL